MVFGGASLDLEIEGRTALSEAVAWANEESIQKLATLGADMNFKTEGASQLILFDVSQPMPLDAI